MFYSGYVIAYGVLIHCFQPLSVGDNSRVLGFLVKVATFAKVVLYSYQC